MYQHKKVDLSTRYSHYVDNIMSIKKIKTKHFNIKIHNIKILYLVLDGKQRIEYNCNDVF